MELICPKCRGTMRSYERSGITVDQCSECRGIFLDRGELERLVDAETAFHASAAAVPAPATPTAPSYGSPTGDRYRDERSRDDRYRDERDRDQGYGDDRYKVDRYKDDQYRSRDGYYDSRKKKKRSFLEDLFD
jgi:Zn-finger nucleic acid-binding protein